MNLITPEEEKRLRDSHPHCAEELVEWAKRIRMENALLAVILHGRIQVKHIEAGEPVLSLTEAGIEYVETVLLPRSRP